ncbi:MAG: pyridoxal phosphate-dependent aminotransferase [Rubellimicrobium sp.]|nr:pyridoxal phosphate-dependent aminotransferase [Rubellimicrobium sp.]
MKTASITKRLEGLGGSKWELDTRARDLQAAGRDVILLTIGEPEDPTPPALVEVAVEAMRRGRTGYSYGQGEPGLCRALARRYCERTGRPISERQVLCFPGTQTALFSVMFGLAEAGDEVLVGDPMYLAYEGVVRAPGATLVPVPMRPENGFRMRAEDLEACVTPRSRAVLLTNPHNPTGVVLTRAEVRAIGEVARAHDLWIVSDEVYEDLILDGSPFYSPLADPDLADRTIVVASISKSHSAAGFRSGWAICPEPFAEALLPFSETMLFGNQPFIADMTEAAVSAPSPIAPAIADRFDRLAGALVAGLEGTVLQVHRPQAGMFALIDARATGLGGRDYALSLLDATGVAVLPGEGFGQMMAGWVRVSLTVPEADFLRAIGLIRSHALSLVPEPAAV